MIHVRLAIVFATALCAFPALARADDLPGPPVDYCTVNRKCSSAGVTCAAGDRACMNDATSRGLEIVCEDDPGKSPTGDKRPPVNKLVYCQPGTGHADSKIVWVLLAAATVLAVGGSTVGWIVFRKKT